MSEDRSPKNLEQLLDQVCETTHNGDSVSLDSILNVVGRRSFAPLLLLAGVVTVLPIIGDIPGVPTVMGVLVLLVAGQVLFRREHIWLPRWLLDRSLARDKLIKGVAWSRSPARFIDRILRPRLTVFANQAALYVIAMLCAVIGATMPIMEVVPFSANFAGAALTAFGLALMVHDGVLALLALIFTAMTVGFLVYNLL